MEPHGHGLLPAPAALVDAGPRPGVATIGQSNVQHSIAAAMISATARLEHQAVNDLSRALFARRLRFGTEPLRR
eukprot:1716265-Pyramimonas_sp.AAC.1